jgi:NADP-dependent 3-hydroxy acid dehydrogenase YdfG
MINNAGIAVGGATDALELADWRRVLDVNLAGVIHGVHAVYPRMVRRRAGHIVNLASVAGLAPYPLALPYTTSKHAVVGLSQALRAEAARHGVRVSVACPGRSARRSGSAPRCAATSREAALGCSRGSRR